MSFSPELLSIFEEKISNRRIKGNNKKVIDTILVLKRGFHRDYKCLNEPLVYHIITDFFAGWTQDTLQCYSYMDKEVQSEFKTYLSTLNGEECLNKGQGLIKLYARYMVKYLEAKRAHTLQCNQEYEEAKQLYGESLLRALQDTADEDQVVDAPGDRSRSASIESIKDDCDFGSQSPANFLALKARLKAAAEVQAGCIEDTAEDFTFDSMLRFYKDLI